MHLNTHCENHHHNPEIGTAPGTLNTLNAAQGDSSLTQPEELFPGRCALQVEEMARPRQTGRHHLEALDTGDDMFFNSPSPLSVANSGNFEERMSVYETPEPGPSDTSRRRETDWIFYEPPVELFRPRDTTSVVMESILEPSIRRVAARHTPQGRRQLEPTGAIGPPTRERLHTTDAVSIYNFNCST